jgi:hypothetical protein
LFASLPAHFQNPNLIFLFFDMGSTSIRLLGAVMILLALLTLVLAMVVGGDIVMVIFSLSLAASSMELFRRAQTRRDDED